VCVHKSLRNKFSCRLVGYNWTALLTINSFRTVNVSTGWLSSAYEKIFWIFSVWKVGKHCFRAEWLEYVPTGVTLKTLHFVRALCLYAPYHSCNTQPLFSIHKQMIGLCNRNEYCFLWLVIFVGFSVAPPPLGCRNIIVKEVHLSGSLFCGKFPLTSYFPLAPIAVYTSVSLSSREFQFSEHQSTLLFLAGSSHCAVCLVVSKVV
jgi:hypothetical protein